MLTRVCNPHPEWADYHKYKILMIIPYSGSVLDATNDALNILGNISMTSDRYIIGCVARKKTVALVAIPRKKN